MADFSHRSLLLKMPPAFLPPMNHGLADASPTLPGFLLCSPAAHGHGAAAAAGAAMVEEASLGASSVVLDKKRKVREGSASLSSAHSKDSKESKNRRGKKAMKEMEEEEEAHKGYIHVRARRGQATDSHSLAERLRRERISERMRMLQALVPGCDKVTGKALILDEIINYVQSLQNQVEFLSMRIASLSPVLYGFGLDSDAHNDHTQNIGAMSPEAMPSPVLNQASPAPSQAIMDTLQGQGGISFPQDNGGYLMQTIGDAKQEELINQVMFNYICSFQ